MTGPVQKWTPGARNRHKLELKETRWLIVARFVHRTTNSGAWIGDGLHRHGAIHLLVALARPSAGASEAGQLVQESVVPIVFDTRACRGRCRTVLIASIYGK
jgi:hypothetical protein